MRSCVLTFFGKSDERDDLLGLPVPFYRYHIVAASSAAGVPAPAGG